MKPEDAVVLYLDHDRQRHLSDSTVRANLFLLQHLSEYCRLHGVADLRDATTDTLLDYHRWFRTRKRPDGEAHSTAYINAHARRAKTLFKFLAERHYIMTDIGKDFPPLHDVKPLPRGIMNKDQVMQLLQQPPMTTPLGFRDRAMLEVLYSTALRGCELCRLSLYDFDAQERMIRVIAGKGKKDRVVPIGKVAAGYLAEYIKTVRPVLVGETQNSWIFLSATGCRLVTNDLHRLVKRYRETAGLPAAVTTHSLRHTCATEMLKGGASIRHVQELLGHSDIMTTQIYTHVVPIDLKKAHARTAPSERRKTVEKVEFLAGGAVRWTDKRNAKYWPKVHRSSPSEGGSKLRAKPVEKC
ncbi:MAG: tyrosine-type recombinase/integrase [Planctomycetota bacterium]